MSRGPVLLFQLVERKAVPKLGSYASADFKPDPLYHVIRHLASPGNWWLIETWWSARGFLFLMSKRLSLLPPILRPPLSSPSDHCKLIQLASTCGNSTACVCYLNWKPVDHPPPPPPPPPLTDRWTCGKGRPRATNTINTLRL